MVQNPERRKFPRIDSKIEVKFQSGQEFVQAYTQNISRGGIYLESETLPDPNAKIELIMDLSGMEEDVSHKHITLYGRVVRLISVAEDGKTVHKIGIQFVDLSPQLQLRLDKLCSNLENKS